MNKALKIILGIAVTYFLIVIVLAITKSCPYRNLMPTIGGHAAIPAWQLVFCPFAKNVY